MGTRLCKWPAYRGLHEMSSVATFPPVAAKPASRRRLWQWAGVVLAVVLLSPGVLAFPPVWHGAVRTALAWQASRHRYELTVGQVHGGLFGSTRLDDLRLRAAGGTDLTATRATFRFFAGASLLHRPTAWLGEVRLEGVRGSLDLASGAAVAGEPPARRHFSGPGTDWLPANFSLQADEFCLRRGRDTARLLGLSVTGGRGEPGAFEVREVRAEGPGFVWTLPGAHGRTFWKDGFLTFSSVSARDPGTAANGTLDLTRLERGRLKWECSLRMADGEVRGQGAVDFSRADAPLEVAATMRRTALAPFARLLGVRGTVDGEVEQASFTFRGDPDALPAAQMSLSGRATGFRWEDRRWQSLEMQAVVLNRRVQLNRFDLRQDGNRLALSGEYPLPPVDGSALRWTGEGSWWQAAGFAGNVDARLEDLGALARLIGPGAPELAGRMSVNGRLSAAAGSAEVAGYLNVEGTRLDVLGAPLDYLRSTLVFRRGAVEVADLQATQGADYFTARGVVGLSGENAARHGELRAEVRDASVYLPALAGWPALAGRIAPVRGLDAVLRVQNGELIFDRWEGEAAENLLAQ